MKKYDDKIILWSDRGRDSAALKAVRNLGVQLLRLKNISDIILLWHEEKPKILVIDRDALDDHDLLALVKVATELGDAFRVLVVMNPTLLDSGIRNLLKKGVVSQCHKPDDAAAIQAAIMPRLCMETQQDIIQALIFGSRKKDEAVGKLYKDLLNSREEIGSEVTSLKKEVASVQADKSRLERQLEQEQKLKTVRMIAGGLSHDFNNIVMAMHNTLQLIEARFEKAGKSIWDEPLLKGFSNLFQCSGRARELAERLSTLSHQNKIKLKPISSTKIIRQVMQICATSLPDEISLNLLCAEDDQWVDCDDTLLEQVLYNLCINARDTMLDTGAQKRPMALTVSVDGFIADSVFCEQHPRAKCDQSYVCFSVKDTGQGISDENLSRIFDPFFTTKGEGKGTGMGLAMVSEIVDQHNGLLAIYTELGKGSIFRIYLPVSHRKPKKIKTIAPVVPDGLSTVLLIDDEPLILDATKAIFECHGYQILSAHSGEEGLELFKQNKGIIELVMSDFVMPQMSGIDVFEAMKKIKPELHFILASGFTADKRIKALLKNGLSGFVEKPYNIEALLTTVYNLLVGKNRKKRIGSNRILLVEDEIALNKLYKSALEKKGFKVDSFYNGKEAWQAYLQSATMPYHLVLTDHMMPVMSGLDLVNKIRAVDRELPIVMLTADKSRETMREAARAQITDFLDKPITLNSLTDLMGQYIK